MEGGSGFDAVVWRIKIGSELAGPNNQNAGKVYVSMRGTEPDAGGADLIDDINLASAGVPYYQMVSMVNWWLRETAVAGAPLKQLKLDNTLAPTGFVMDTAVTTASTTGSLVSVSRIEAVNGHSLGGYLATAFTRLFGERWQVDHTATFNSAGFRTSQANDIQTAFVQIQNLIGPALGRSAFNTEAQQDNKYAGNGINLTTNAAMGTLGFTQYGERTGLYQEEGTGLPNHSMYKLTDYLELGAALEKLDPTLTFAKLNELVKAASNDMKGSYEGVLDGLRRMLIDRNISPIPTGDVSDSESSRKTYHEVIKQLTDLFAEPSGTLKALAGKLTLSLPTTSLATAAKTDFAAFLSLNALSPVVISTTDAAAIAALKTANANLSTAWTADKNARQYGDTTKVLDYSDNWYTDRTAMLGKLLERNVADNQSNLPGSSNIRYFDKTSNTQILVGSGSAQRQQFIFGSDGDDDATVLSGQGFADHLYGGAGNDVLDGKGGKDDIFGDEGDDLIAGGAGSDNLRGGDGNDVIKIAMQFIATYAYPISSSGRFDSKTRSMNDANWRAAA